MRQEVAADLAEVRGRVQARLLVRAEQRQLEMPPLSVYLGTEGNEPAEPSEDEHAETQPTGAALGYLLAVLAGVVGTWLMVNGPMWANRAWLWFGR